MKEFASSGEMGDRDSCLNFLPSIDFAFVNDKSFGESTVRSVVVSFGTSDASDASSSDVDKSISSEPSCPMLEHGTEAMFLVKRPPMISGLVECPLNLVRATLLAVADDVRGGVSDI